MFDEFERIESKRSRFNGLVVGFYKDYGDAQMIHNKRVYLMDSQGRVYKNNEVQPAEQLMVDDDLLMYLI